MNVPISKVFFSEEEEKEMIKVLRSGWVMQGPKVAMFEEEIASYVGTEYSVAVSSGTAALHLSLVALGIKKGDEVIVPSFSFIATANCVLYVGATPVFADIDDKTFNINPEDVERKISKRTKAIIATHQIGLPADLDAIKKICEKHNIYLIEDAACALGATYRGKKVGGFGKLSCFSFHPRKSITTGEGGMITTDGKELADKIRVLRSHGCIKKNNKEFYEYLGYNYRMTDLQAALGRAQFKKIDRILDSHQKIAMRYTNAFKNNPFIVVPHVPEYMSHTYQSYMILVKHPLFSRDQIARALGEKGIATRNGIMLIHEEPLYKKLFGKVRLKKSEDIGKRSLILPLFTQMTQEEQDYVITELQSILKA